MAIDERLLHRMERAVIGLQAFDGEHRLAVDRWQQPDACVDGFPGDAPANPLGNDDRAGATIAFRTAFRRPGQPALDAQDLQQRRLRREAGDVDAFSVQQEADRLAHTGP